MTQKKRAAQATPFTIHRNYPLRTLGLHPQFGRVQPLISSSSLTRIPMTVFNTVHRMPLVTQTNNPTITIEMICTLKLASPFVSGTAKVPKYQPIGERGSHPQHRQSSYDPTLEPLDNDHATDTANQCRRTHDGVKGSAVMETRPANAPFRIMVRSGLRYSICVRIATIAPPAAAAFVLAKTEMSATSPIDPIANCEPPLKPNQPIHRINVPNVASGRNLHRDHTAIFCVFTDTWTMISAPINAAHPPTE